MWLNIFPLSLLQPVPLPLREDLEIQNFLAPQLKVQLGVNACQGILDGYGVRLVTCSMRV